ncbi:hypothetical protein HDU93_006496 [Gonapodya sp. JEL0774]|nr:hypothetical protein HDU93_006496 [Gonapodya sp. JEL0774]
MTLPTVPQDSGPFLFIPATPDAFSNAANSSGPIAGPGHGIIRTHNIQSLSKAARKKLRRSSLREAGEIGIDAPLAQFVLSTTSVIYVPDAPTTTKFVAFPLPEVLPKPHPMLDPAARPLYIPSVERGPPPPQQNRTNLSVTAPSRCKNCNSVKDLGLAAFAADVATRLQNQAGSSSDSESDSEREMPKSVKPRIVNVRPGPDPYSVQIAAGDASVVMFGARHNPANPTATAGAGQRPMSPPARLTLRLKSSRKPNSDSPKPPRPHAATEESTDRLLEQGGSSPNKKPHCNRCDLLGTYIVHFKAEREAHKELSTTYRDALLVLMRVVKRALDERRSDGDLQDLTEDPQNHTAGIDGEENGNGPTDMNSDQEEMLVPSAQLSRSEDEDSSEAGTSGESGEMGLDIGSQAVPGYEGEAQHERRDTPPSGNQSVHDPRPVTPASPATDRTLATTPAARRHLLRVLTEFGLSFSDVDRISVLTGIDLLEIVGRHVRGTAIFSGRKAVPITPDATRTEDLVDGNGRVSEVDETVARRVSGETERQVTASTSHKRSRSDPIDVDALRTPDEDGLEDMEVVWVQSETGHWGLGLEKADEPIGAAASCSEPISTSASYTPHTTVDPRVRRPVLEKEFAKFRPEWTKEVKVKAEGEKRDEKSQDQPPKKRKLEEQYSASAQTPFAGKKLREK